MSPWDRVFVSRRERILSPIIMPPLHHNYTSRASLLRADFVTFHSLLSHLAGPVVRPRRLISPVPSRNTSPRPTEGSAKPFECERPPFGLSPFLALAASGTEASRPFPLP